MTDQTTTDPAEDIADTAATSDGSIGAEAAGARGLPDPTPLDQPRTPATFPVDAFPTAWLRDRVEAEHVATQTPPDLAGMCALGVLAACAGGRAVVEARRGWREPVNLYLLPVLPPGSRKSAVVASMTKPLLAAEGDLAQRAAEAIAEQATLREIAQKALEKALREAANAKGDKRHELSVEAVSAAQDVERLEVPVSPRLLADDATPEAVSSLLAMHDGRLAIISAEGGVFDVMGGRYNRGTPVLDVWLKGHAGDPLRVDRKGRDPEYVKSPALTLMLTVQPSVLTAIARNGEFRGRGLLARFLYSLPADNVGHRQVGTAPVPEDVAEAYDTNVRKLVDDMAAWTDPAILTLDPAAQALLLGFEKAIEPRLRRDGEYGGIREWGSKLVGATLRIAGLLHLAAEAEAFRRPITEATLSAAIRFASYLAEHAQAAFGLLGESATSDAAYLLEWLNRHQLEEFSIRDLHVDLPRGRFATSDDVAAAVAVLVDHDWVIPQPPPEKHGPGRKKSPRFRCHPKVLTESTQSTKSADSAPSDAPKEDAT